MQLQGKYGNLTYQIDRDGKLQVELLGFWNQVQGEARVRVDFRFADGVQDRLYPLVSQNRTVASQVIWSASGVIDLSYVFLYGSNADTVRVTPIIFYGEERISLEEMEFSLEGKYFRSGGRLPSKENPLRLSGEKKGRTLGVRLLQSCLQIATVCNLPLMLFEGMMAERGYGKLQLEGKVASGKKAVIFHANNKIRNFTGYSFSVREKKTRYLQEKYRKYCKLPIKEKGILFLSERRVEEDSNLSLIRQSLQKLSGADCDAFLETATVDRLSKKQLRELAMKLAVAKVIVLEDFYPQLHQLDLREETKVVQLWHACGAFKTFGFGRLGKIGGPAEHSGNHRCYDRVYVSSEQMIPYYSEAFAIPEKNVRALGVARTDCFFQDSFQKCQKEKWLAKYPAWKGKRLVVFAPTFRGDGNKDAYYPMTHFSVDSFMSQMPEDVCLLIKHHPFVKMQMEIPQPWQERVFDVTKEGGINSLLPLTAVLITDYSSSVFEATLLDIPMVFYAFDEVQYMEERSIYENFSYFAPGPICATEEDLCELTLQALQKGADTEKMQGFYRRYLSALDGHSRERIVADIRELAGV